jgi:hypothetical protein
MLEVNFNTAKSMFFDRQKILEPADEAEKKILSRFGAYCRTAARNLIRTEPGSSQPGDPPEGHNGPIRYKDTIFFAWDRERHAVVIGGVLVGGSGGQYVPGVIEFGGDEVIFTGGRRNRRQVLAHYEPRPHMRPAFNATLEKLEDWLKGCITDAASHTVTINL